MGKSPWKRRGRPRGEGRGQGSHPDGATCVSSVAGTRSRRGGLDKGTAPSASASVWGKPPRSPRPKPSPEAGHPGSSLAPLERRPRCPERASPSAVSPARPSGGQCDSLSPRLARPQSPLVFTATAMGTSLPGPGAPAPQRGPPQLPLPSLFSAAARGGDPPGPPLRASCRSLGGLLCVSPVVGLLCRWTSAAPSSGRCRPRVAATRP